MTFSEFTNNAAAKKDAELLYRYYHEKGDRIKQNMEFQLERYACEYGEEDFEYQISSNKDKNGEYFVGIYKIPKPVSNPRHDGTPLTTQNAKKEFKKSFEIGEGSPEAKGFPKHSRLDSKDSLYEILEK